MKTNIDKFRRFLKRTFSVELFVGLGVVLREMLKKNSNHTMFYPMEKVNIDARYRGVHKLLRLAESGNERCIGCGLCEKICVSNCIAMDTKLGEDGRKKVINYSINLGRCVYCGLCADVCPELAIVHGGDYEFASEQRAYYGFKEDFLTNIKDLKEQKEFEGYGALPNDADFKVKLTPTTYIKKDQEND
ncbi:NADH-quinone oxidoreductase subunit NuoI [Campylobacter blaseri]|uniref:NADH-quinone oxidoreductase subunit NuoI n=1 Tax=Campylobacter blaseri TaxID=2042961 RepID=UPI001F4E3F7C|nr:NADH-quinone oxidoreductase subunit NuoI [Campylobacter blaseri]